MTIGADLWGERGAWLALTVGCAACSPAAADTQAPDAAPIAYVQCAGQPSARAGKFHHKRSLLISSLAHPRHRGVDLVAADDAASQTLEGWLGYTFVDKALEDEDVELFACSAGAWQRLGTTRSDREGHFALALTGPDRLPTGMRDLFVSVVGDRTGAAFLGLVAPHATPLVVSDVDGTLTSSENAFFETIALGIEPDARAGAARAFAAASAAGRQLVYVTARGNRYTSTTRAWLDHHGFPRGPVRLAPSLVTPPGSDTVDYKTRTIAALAAQMTLTAGVGNRASDVLAYARTGVVADHIFIELPEFAGEVQPLVDAHRAIGFSHYDELAGKL